MKVKILQKKFNWFILQNYVIYMKFIKTYIKIVNFYYGLFD